MPIIATYNDDQPTELEKKLLMSLVFTSDLKEDERDVIMNRINNCTDYKEFEKIQFELEVSQESIHSIQNPSQKDIMNFINRIA